jgi:hypothetical protein
MNNIITQNKNHFNNEEQVIDENKDTNTVVEGDEGDEGDKLPDYEDDEDYRKLMNEAIMNRIMNPLDEEPYKKNKKKKQLVANPVKPMANNSRLHNVSLGSFIKSVNDNEPKVFVSKRKLDKIGVVTKRQFNPRKMPYLLFNNTQNKNKTELNDEDFPSL